MTPRLLQRLSLVVALALPVPGNASDLDRDLDRLMELLAFSETVDIMRDEGLRHGAQLAVDMLPGADAENWQMTVSRIYDAQKMLRLISQDFREELSGADLTPMIAFFAGENGQEIVALELATRRAFLDPETEAEAVAQCAKLMREDVEIINDIETIMDDSDLVEFNVMGTLNSSLMFYRGLSEGGAYDISESDILADAWSQEEETRRSAREWLAAFLTMAYRPLEPEKLEDYSAFYRTPSGRELNRAIFAAFDQMYEELSYLMGLAVAEHMTSKPL